MLFHIGVDKLHLIKGNLKLNDFGRDGIKRIAQGKMDKHV